MIAKIQELLEEVEKLKASNLEEVEALRIKYLSKKGSLNALMADFRNVPAEMKKEVGMKLNDLKAKAQEKIAALKEAVDTQDCGTDELDLTRTAYPVSLGTRHPLTIVKNEIVDIFSRLGFTLAEGPEIEDDWHVYSSMNFADDHPARDMQDTFFVEARPDIVLRSHTSSVQARVMESQQPPIRVVCPGRVYRNEAISARAHCFFHQVEGLYIDKNVSFTDLKQVLLLFAQEMFGKGTKNTSPSVLFPLHGTVCRNGHQLQHLRRRGLFLLQAYRMGGNSRMRHGRPGRTRSQRHRQQRLYRICFRHGYRTYHQSEIPGEGFAHVL